MPASFEQEALKAQAIVARTYTIYKINNKKHVMQIYVTVVYVAKLGFLKKIGYQKGWRPKTKLLGKNFKCCKFY